MHLRTAEQGHHSSTSVIQVRHALQGVRRRTDFGKRLSSVIRPSCTNLLESGPLGIEKRTSFDVFGNQDASTNGKLAPSMKNTQSHSLFSVCYNEKCCYSYFGSLGLCFRLTLLKKWCQPRQCTWLSLTMCRNGIFKYLNWNRTKSV